MGAPYLGAHILAFHVSPELRYIRHYGRISDQEVLYNGIKYSG